MTRQPTESIRHQQLQRPGQAMKRCKQCGELKPLELFPKTPNTKDGRLNRCRDCDNEQVRRQRAARLAHPLKAPAPKACVRCGKIQPPEMFQRDGDRSDGLSAKCKTCIREQRTARAASRRIAPPLDGVKRCARCQQIKPLESFGLRPDTRDGRDTRCKDCRNAAERARHAAKARLLGSWHKPVDIREADDRTVRGLAAAVFLQAVIDLQHRDIIHALDAALWLTGPEAALWLDGLHTPDMDPLELLTSGQLATRARLHR